MDIFEILNNYEDIKNEYNEIENYATEYENEYQSLRNCGWDDQDTKTHAMGVTARHYENEMNQIEKEMQKYEDLLLDETKLAKILVENFKHIEINTLLQKLSEFYNCYENDKCVYSSPYFFLHDNGLMMLNDMINFNYINDFKWNIKQEDYIIIIQNNQVTSCTQKEFFNWLINDLSNWCLYDNEITEELEILLQIINPKYINLRW